MVTPWRFSLVAFSAVVRTGEARGCRNPGNRQGAGERWKWTMEVDVKNKKTTNNKFERVIKRNKRK